jgi:hypothetical protein
LISLMFQSITLKRYRSMTTMEHYRSTTTLTIANYLHREKTGQSRPMSGCLVTRTGPLARKAQL